MNILFWIIVIVVSLVIFLALFFFGFAYAMANFMKPNSEKESIAQIKKFLGYDFAEDFQIIEHESRNNHPDRPLRIVLNLNENGINNLKAFTSEIESYSKETGSNNQSYKYNEDVMSSASFYQKCHEAFEIIHSGEESLFFRATLIINYESGTLSYSETGF
jgi:hypothetical protein